MRLQSARRVCEGGDAASRPARFRFRYRGRVRQRARGLSDRHQERVSERRGGERRPAAARRPGAGGERRLAGPRHPRAGGHAAQARRRYRLSTHRQLSRARPLSPSFSTAVRPQLQSTRPGA